MRFVYYLKQFSTLALEVLFPASTWAVTFLTLFREPILFLVFRHSKLEDICMFQQTQFFFNLRYIVLWIISLIMACFVDPSSIVNL